MVTLPVPVTFAANGTEAVQPGAMSALTVIGSGHVTVNDALRATVTSSLAMLSHPIEV